MRRFLLYLLCLAFLLITVAVGWWTVSLGPQDATTYRVQAGDTPNQVAADLGVPVAELARVNGVTAETWTLVPGTEILVPERPVSALDRARFHGIGLGCQLGGLVAGFLLALAGGLVPRAVRQPAFVAAVILGLTSYFFSRAISDGVGWLSPQVAFDMVKDGFAWSALVAMLARAIGLREPKSIATPPPEADAGS